MLLMSVSAGATGLVLCLGSDGHRALEFEHAEMRCPSFAGPQDDGGVTIQRSSACIDLPAPGTGAILLSSIDPDPVPAPPLAFLVAGLEPARRIEERLPRSVEARAGPVRLTGQLRSTVLRV